MKKEKKHLKILAVGDLHGDSAKASKLAELAVKEKVDLIILAGDLTFGENKIDYLIGPFAKRKLNILFVPGNHESLATADFLEKLYEPYAKNLHGDGKILGEIGFFGAGGATVGPFFLSENDIYEALRKGFEKVKKSKKKVMVTHSHPSGTLMEKLGVSFIKGSSAVRKAIEKFKPDIAIVSHIHEAEGIEEKIGKTKVINVGRKGKIITI
ncbi:MAG: metallophosphoesterase [Candidatus Pacearchaeota archaeon]|nr:metallophosphoesterase [Candidatus Pacearchaeota archaeon]